MPGEGFSAKAGAISRGSPTDTPRREALTSSRAICPGEEGRDPVEGVGAEKGVGMSACTMRLERVPSFARRR